MLHSLIDRYKSHRKQQLLNNITSLKQSYAFVGVGGHSLANLYPMIDYFGVPLKYICTKNSANAEKMARKYSNCIGTSSLDTILNDEEVKGVFICSSPASHFELCKQVLAAGKHLFVEKPPCLISEELKQLIAISTPQQHVVVGLQKRFAPVYNYLKKHAKLSNSTYNYRFVTGAYPEGNALIDLYIHAFDLVVFLFGNTIKSTFLTSQDNKTIFVQLQHSNGACGQIELSTAYHWEQAKEIITINDNDSVWHSESIFDLMYTKKKKSIAGIPLEKVFKSPIEQHIIYNNRGFVPIAENNSLKMAGYADEVNYFLSGCEGKISAKNHLTDLQEVYRLMGL